MAKIINENRGYEVIPRDLIFDTTLSDRARFVYVFMSAKPEGWDFFLEPMAREIGYSIDTLRKYINELAASGWLVKGEQSNDKGSFGAVSYTLRATKFTDTVKYRHGKIPTQDNIDNKENIDSKEKRKIIDGKPSIKENEKGLFDNDETIVTMSTNNQTNEKENDDAFVDKIYKMYPTKCPVRGVSLGKTHADKKRIKNLLKRYTQEQIEKVVESEVRNKHGKYSMKNFSTFLNNFPDPDGICDNTRPRNNEPVGFHLDEGVRERMREAKEDGSGEW